MLQVYGSPMRLWLFHIPAIFVSDPDDVQMLLSKNLEKHETYRFLAHLIGDGLITADNYRWKINRRIISPAFNLNTLADNFLKSFNNQNEKLVRKLKKHCDDNKLFDISEYIDSTSFSTICETAMDYKDDEEIEFLEFKAALIKAADLIAERFYKIWLHSDFVFKLYTRIIGMSNIFEKAKALPKTILRKKYQNQRLNSNTHTKDETNDGKKPECIVDILYKLYDNKHFLTEKELTDEILTLIFAGSETTAIAISFTLMMLAMRPDVQAKVHEELDVVFGSNKNPPTAKELYQLKFLEQCIKETLRRFIVVPLILRQTDEDLKLKSGEIIPAGSAIVMSIGSIHLNERTYPNPYTWNPNNFDDDSIAKRHPGTFLPFSGGSRMCVGNKYALLSIKTQLSTLLRNYRFTTTSCEEDIKLKLDVIVRSANGYRIMLHSRH
ncbi:hypothetical protein V9T40_005756 [Parthenolecanium corni]|uniref:Cytochrome P450 n=1 Tax=Parthenolecanium corni TaxID=536013 RepID=A0AAN9TX67_9HEMI